MLCAVIAAATVVADAAGQKLAALVALAMKRADLTQDYVARCTGIPPNKLSEQLAGKTPFTGLYRILSNVELRQETELWCELVELLAHEIDRRVVPVDLGTIVAKLEEIVGKPKAARMDLQTREERAVS